MLLIIEPAGQRRERTEDEGRQLYDRMLRFGGELAAEGVLLAAQSLRTDAEGVLLARLAASAGAAASGATAPSYRRSPTAVSRANRVASKRRS